MTLDPVALSTLAAAVSEGTFERAAARLHVTPSAVSQRIRGLEQSVGQVVASRTKPVTPTPAGEVLLRLAGHWQLLVHDALDELMPEASGTAYPVVQVVVNADSLATWLLPALAEASAEVGVSLDLIREDEEHASELIRSGAALAAVTADPTPVPGCRLTPLGSLRYLAVCSPAFGARWLPQGAKGVDLDRAPMVRFDRKDLLQHRVARRWVRRDIDPPATFVGSTRECAEAIRLGMGWGVIPIGWAEPLLGTGELALVTSAQQASIDVPLFWLARTLPSRVLDTLTSSVLQAAAGSLRPRDGRQRDPEVGH